MNFSVTEAEVELIRDVLANNHRELLLEIARAEHHEFRRALQKREELLKTVMDKLAVAQPTHS